MKIRNGFVSNSSSSSFVVITKGKELQKDMFEKVFEKSKDTPFEDVVDDVIQSFYNNSIRNVKYYGTDGKSYLKEYDYNSFDEFIENSYLGRNLKGKELKDNFKYYFGSVSDQDCDVGEMVLCNIGIDYEDDDIIIIKEGGY